MHRNENLFELLGLLVLLFIAWLAIAAIIKALKDLFGYTTVFEFQRGILYRQGKVHKVLEAGRYLLMRWQDTVTVVDMREQILSVINQELVCADAFSIRLSAAVVYKVTDPVRATEQTRSAYEQLYLDTQLIMREVTAGMKVEQILEQRNELSKRIEEELKGQGAKIGIEIVKAGVRDITFPADVKKAFTQVSQAEKAAQAQLAKSRAETASLRALANAAKMIESNPNLLALRSLQSIGELASSSGNTIVLGVPSPMVPMPGTTSGATSSQSQDSVSEIE